MNHPCGCFPVRQQLIKSTFSGDGENMRLYYRTGFALILLKILCILEEHFKDGEIS